MNHCTCCCTNDGWCIKTLWAYMQVLFESLFCLTKLSNMAMVRDLEVMLGQTLNNFV
jgi:hypothetical protein